MIAFPVFKSLTIEKYGLFPESLKHPYFVEFLPGQNAIIGVNGSGKSTMINIALRCLIGPFNLPAATSEAELGQVRPKPVAMPRGERQLFARRVADGAASASATIEVTFGTKTLKITRQLSDLALVGCVVNDRLSVVANTDRHVHTDEAAYQNEIAGCFGIASFFDALIIFHFLIFMLEDRRSLVWDPSAQRQIFKVLLLSKERATEYAAAQQDVISKDSSFRNTRQQINKHGAKLTSAKTQVKTIKAAEAERRVLNKEAIAIRDQIEQVTQARFEADKERQSARLARLKSAESRESIVRELERLKIESLGSLLGPSQATLRYVISQMLAEHRCLVCGTDPSPVADQIDKWVGAGRCPICGSKHQVPEKIVPLTDAHRRRIVRLEQELEYADKQIAEADARISVAVTEFEKQDDYYQKLEMKRLNVDARIVDVLRRIPTERAAIGSSQNALDFLQNILRREERALKKAEKRFSKIVAEAVKGVEQAQEKIEASFKKYLRVFLKEGAALVYQTVRDKVGQGKTSFDFPAFHLTMTGGAVAGSTMRESPREVSQSQAEFIDLAFRMALMTVVAHGGAATLIVDAPEASLDFLFAERAGTQLATFSKAQTENRVIVTSYLPSAHLLNSFFAGISGASRRQQRIVDLIKHAAPNAAMRADREKYEAFLATIVQKRE